MPAPFRTQPLYIVTPMEGIPARAAIATCIAGFAAVAAALAF